MSCHYEGIEFICLRGIMSSPKCTDCSFSCSLVTASGVSFRQNACHASSFLFFVPAGHNLGTVPRRGVFLNTQGRCCYMGKRGPPPIEQSGPTSYCFINLSLIGDSCCEEALPCGFALGARRVHLDEGINHALLK